MVIGWVCDGTSKIHDERSWRIPLGLFFIIPTIIASLIWFIPEVRSSQFWVPVMFSDVNREQSPRWLLIQGHTEEARANLTKLRERAFDLHEIEEEFLSIQTGLQNEPEQSHFKELFSRSNRKRTAIVVGLNFFQQATGQAFASQYGTIYVKSLQTINSFNFNVINGFIGLVIVLLCLYLNDRVGRR
jgi:hypothetical protein